MDGAVTWRVRFRSSDGRNRSETFTTQRAADVFCQDLAEVGPEVAVKLLDEAEAREHSPPSTPHLTPG